MAKKIFRGDSINIAQQSLIPTPPAGFEGAITLGISNKSLTFEEWNASAIVAGWNASRIEELRNATASVHADGVLLTATQAGVPFEVWARFGDSSEVDEAFTVVLSNLGESPSGTYTLTAFGETITLAPDATANEVKTALEATAAIAPGDIAVELVATSPQRQYRITLGGNYAGVDVPNFTVDGSGLRGGTADVITAELQEFAAPRNKRVRVNINGTPTSGDHDLVVGETTVGPIAYNANQAAIQAACDADLGSGEAVVSQVSNGGGSTLATYEIELQGSRAATNPAISTTNRIVPTSGNTIWEIDATYASPSQPGRLALYDAASGSQVLVDSAGSMTTGSASRVTLAEGLDEILTSLVGVGNYRVTKQAAVHTIELIGAAAGAQPDFDDYSWTWSPIPDTDPPSPRFSWSKQQAGGAAQPQRFRVAFDGTQLSGTWALKIGAHTSASISLDDNAAAIQTKVGALPPIGAGNVTVTGSYASGWTFELDPSLGQLDLATVSVVNNLAAVDVQLTNSASYGAGPYTHALQIAFVGNPTSGQFRLGFDGFGDGIWWTINAFATASQIKSQLEIGVYFEEATVSWTPGVGGSLTLESTSLHSILPPENLSLVGPKPAVTITGLQDYQAAADTRYRIQIDWRANDGYIRFRRDSAYADQYLNGGEPTEDVLTSLISGALSGDITRRFVEVTTEGDQVYDIVFDGDDLAGNDYTITAENNISISSSYGFANSTTEALGTDGVAISVTTLQTGSPTVPAQHSLRLTGSPHFGTYTLDVEASDGGLAFGASGTPGDYSHGYYQSFWIVSGVNGQSYFGENGRPEVFLGSISFDSPIPQGTVLASAELTVDAGAHVSPVSPVPFSARAVTNRTTVPTNGTELSDSNETSAAVTGNMLSAGATNTIELAPILNELLQTREVSSFVLDLRASSGYMNLDWSTASITATTGAAEPPSGTTDALDYDADETEIAAALEAIVGEGRVVAVGSTSDGQLLEFSTELGTVTLTASNVDLANLAVDITGNQDGGKLEVRELVRSAGLWHFDDPLNWKALDGDDDGIPNSGDEITFDSGRISCLYGLRQRTTFTADTSSGELQLADRADFRTGQDVMLSSSDTLPTGLADNLVYTIAAYDRDTRRVSLQRNGVDQTPSDQGTGAHTIRLALDEITHRALYTGTIGLPQWNTAGYREYLPTSLLIGFAPDGSRRMTLGLGNGTGSGRMKFDVGGDQVAIEVHRTPNSSEANVPALLLSGTHEDNELDVLAGDLGLGFFDGQAFAFSRIRIHGGRVNYGTLISAENADLQVLGGSIDGQDLQMSGRVRITR